MESNFSISFLMVQVFAAQAHHRVGTLLQILIADTHIDYGCGKNICRGNGAFIGLGMRSDWFKRQALQVFGKATGWYF